LNLRANYEELCANFTNIDLEAEGIEHIGVAKQTILVVGEILEICQLPNVDRLLLSKVYVGENEVRQIFCVAKNFKFNEIFCLATLSHQY
jgi:tRNA-binding EMAP/Myf-like protein